MSGEDYHLDRKHGDFLGSIDVVPNAEVAAILRNHNIAQRHPLHVTAVVEDGGSFLRLDVTQVQLERSAKCTTVNQHTVCNSTTQRRVYLESLVSEEQLASSFVQLEPINLGVVTELSQESATQQIHYNTQLQPYVCQSLNHSNK